MLVTINSEEIELNFGIRFVRELDKKHNIVADGGKQIGMGLEELIPQLILGSIDALEEIIYTAMWGEKKKPTHDEMDDYMDSVEDIDSLFENVMNELKNQNATKKRALALVADIEERAAALEAMKKTQRTMKKNTKS